MKHSLGAEASVSARRGSRGARFVALGVATAFLASLPFFFPGQTSKSARTAATTASAPHPLIGKYCMSCHDAEEHKGNLAFESLSLEHIGTDAEIWEKVARKVGAGVMPPVGSPRPTRAEADEFILTLNQRLDAAAPAPAPVVLRRLNRTEYTNVIRDLLGMQIDAATLLPPDAASKGFDNIAAVLSTSPALIQSYLDAGMKISRLAVGDLATEPERTVYRAPRALNQEKQLEGLPLGTRGGMTVTHFFPLDGEYEFSVEAGPGSSGFMRRAPGPMPEIDLTVDGRAVPVRHAGPVRDSPVINGPTRIKVAAGLRTVSAALVDPTTAAGVNDLYSVFPRKGAIFNIVVNGPFQPTGPGNTASRQKIFVCRPRASTDEQSCAREIVTRLATRAFRTPLESSSEDVSRIMRFYDEGRAKGGFEGGVQQALAYILMDPRFLYRFEREPETVTPGEAFRISDVDLASRLSFFIWSSIPDEELMQAAAAKRLSQPGELERQVNRMLADPKASALVDNFAAQWLQLRQLASAQPEGREFDDNLRQAFEREAKLMFAGVLREDRNVLDLLDADYTYVNERLARFYGIEGVVGDHFRRVSLPKDSPRRGLLGKGAVLTVTSVANRTSPVIRGAWVLENILGVPPSPPPPGVENNLDAAAAKPTTLRERLAQHRVDKVCASCHNVMDPIGLALENYDHIGKWRTLDGNLPIDASGVLMDGTPLAGQADLNKAILARSDEFVETLIEKLMTFGLGRHVTFREMPAVRQVAHEAARNGERFSSLILGIVTSDPFLMRTRSGAESSVPGGVQQKTADVTPQPSNGAS
jgi:mono/diheme cytochrome c family protein/PAS domain-containing protein